MPRPRVGIGLPLVSLKGKPLVSLCSTLCTTDAELALLVTEGAYIPYNRLLLVNLAKEERCDYLFFVDSDVFYPTDALARLLALDKDVAAFHYNMKCSPPMGMCFDLDLTRFPLDDKGNLPFTEPRPVGGIGCGGMLIKLPIFEKLERPYFQIRIDGDDLGVSEDLWFCDRVRRAGFEVWCDPTIKAYHMGEAAY